MTNTKHTDCPDITPNQECNDSCCPEYVPTEDWCKAFNKRTLEHQRNAMERSFDAMWFNIEDARNTIGQMEQHLHVIYELLLAVQDQVVSVSSQAAMTDNDKESAGKAIEVFIKEIQNVIDGAHYNGRSLISRGNVDNDSDYQTPSISFRMAGCNSFCSSSDISTELNDFVLELAELEASYGLDIDLEESESEDGSETIDDQISKVNDAICELGVALDKLRAYRQVLCMREKQIKICKNGQDICFDHKCKL